MPATIHLCNGNFKAGSTWLYQIVRLVTGALPVPDDLQREGWGSSAILLENIPKLLARETGEFFAKAHFGGSAERATLEEYFPNLKVYIMTRDLSDSVLSAFHHYKRLGQVPDQWTLVDFFESAKAPSAKSVIRRLVEYQTTWQNTSPTSPAFMTTYESLHESPMREVLSLAAFAGAEIDEARAEQIVQTTEFDNWKDRTGTKHLRSGIVGESSSALSQEMHDLVEAWSSPL